MKALEFFDHIVKHPREYAEKWKKETHGKVIGHFCSYTPVEIITAAGALPFRIFSSGVDISKADAHLQAYSCSLVRGALEDALSGQLDFLDGTVFPHTCDSIQRLSDIWRMNTNFGFHSDLILPVKLIGESAEEYMTAVLRKFKEALEKNIGVRISEEDLKKGIETCNRVRENLGRLYSLRQKNPHVIQSSDVHTIFKASMIMDAKQAAEKLHGLVIELEGELEGESKGDNDASVPERKRLVLSGGLCTMPDIYDIVETAGGAVVWDDFCTGSRYFEGEIEEMNDPIAAIASRYLKRVNCPAKHSGVLSRGEYLVEKVRQNQADGVIFLFLKFCDPHAFDYPYMKEMLEKQGVPSMLFEIEDQTSSEGQLKTRCEAFMEML